MAFNFGTTPSTPAFQFTAPTPALGSAPAPTFAASIKSKTKSSKKHYKVKGRKGRSKGKTATPTGFDQEQNNAFGAAFAAATIAPPQVTKNAFAACFDTASKTLTSTASTATSSFNTTWSMPLDSGSPPSWFVAYAKDSGCAVAAAAATAAAASAAELTDESIAAMAHDAKAALAVKALAVEEIAIVAARGASSAAAASVDNIEECVERAVNGCRIQRFIRDAHTRKTAAILKTKDALRSQRTSLATRLASANAAADAEAAAQLSIELGAQLSLLRSANIQMRLHPNIFARCAAEKAATKKATPATKTAAAPRAFGAPAAAPAAFGAAVAAPAFGGAAPAFGAAATMAAMATARAAATAAANAPKPFNVKAIKDAACAIERLVGVKAIKVFARRWLADAVRRRLASEPLPTRTVLISGATGIGKADAANCLAALFNACDLTAGAALDVDALTKAGRPIPPPPSVTVKGLAATLQAAPKNVLIMYGSVASIETVEAMYAGETTALTPITLALPALTPSEIATHALRAMLELGYSVDERVTPTSLGATIARSWPTSELAKRNKHIVSDIIDRTIFNKNTAEAKADAGGAEGRPTIAPCRNLTAAHFGIVETTREKAAALKAAVDAELAATVGMGPAKEFIASIRDKVAAVEAGADPIILGTCLNLVVTGNPGVGKTSFARILHRWLIAHGVLQVDNFVECNGLDLKGEYVGSTAPKVQGLFRKAAGGTLFVDEAYSLAGDGQRGRDTYAMEAVRTLLTEVENNRSSMLVIFAGYSDKMDKLLRLDPGLPRRFPHTIHLPDYTPAQISEIASTTARSRYGLELADGVQPLLEEHFATTLAHEIPKNNAALAIRVVEDAVGARAIRAHREAAAAATAGSTISISEADEVKTLCVADFGLVDTDVQEDETHESRVAIDAEIKAMIGMTEPKAWLQRLRRKILFVESGGNPSVLATSLNLIVTGSPGTGKTTFARLLHKFLHAYGILRRDAFVERNGLDLKGSYVGQTAPKVQETFADAMGGTLFIDEAYALAGGRHTDSFSHDAVRTLLTELENNRSKLCVVMAGYKDKMERLMSADPGLPRRFPLQLHLADYTPAELVQIAVKVAKDKFQATLDPSVHALLEHHFGTTLREEIKQHNGGLAVRVVEAAVEAMADRLADVVVLAPKRHACRPDAKYALPTVSTVKDCARRQRTAVTIGLPRLASGDCAQTTILCAAAVCPAVMRTHMRRSAGWSSALATFVGDTMHDVLTPADFGLCSPEEQDAAVEVGAANVAAQSNAIEICGVGSPRSGSPSSVSSTSSQSVYTVIESDDGDGVDDDDAADSSRESDYEDSEQSDMIPIGHMMMNCAEQTAAERFARLYYESPSAANELLDMFAHSQYRRSMKKPLHVPPPPPQLLTLQPEQLKHRTETRILKRGEAMGMPASLSTIKFVDEWSWSGSECVFLDASVLAFGADPSNAFGTGELLGVIDYTHRSSSKRVGAGAVMHSGDVMDGAAKSGTHTVLIDLSKTSDDVDTLLFVLSAWKGKTLYDAKHPKTKFIDTEQEISLCSYELEGNTCAELKGNSAAHMCALRRGGGGWRVHALGELGGGAADEYAAIERKAREHVWGSGTTTR